MSDKPNNKLTWQLFADACSGAKGVYNLKPVDTEVYVALLREAMEGDYSRVKPLKFGCWHFARTKPLSLDFVHGGGMMRYEITLDRLASLDAIAHWVDHLHEKVWFNYREVSDGHGKHPTMVPDSDSPLNFFKAIVALSR